MDAAATMDRRFCYADYRRWPEEERWELIGGVAHAMAGPSCAHQAVMTELSAQIRNYLLSKPCRHYVAPFDVRLAEPDERDDDVTTVVQPDLVVVCDRTKLDDRGCRGAPDRIVEVVSPSSAVMDHDTKRRLYERHGVPEYWIVHPTEQWVMVYTLEAGGRYSAAVMSRTQGTTASRHFPELAIDWAFMADI
jgi:Uma2 family endonuclease